MFELKVNSPNLDDFSVVLIKSTLQDCAVVCGLWSAAEGLPTTVGIDTLGAYASSFQGELHTTRSLLSASIISPTVSPNTSLQDCVASLGQFAQVDFSDTRSWVATYEPTSNMFQLKPS